jgi:hypothetical protein
MRKNVFLFSIALIALLAACGSPPTPTPTSTPNPLPNEVILTGGYRPVQSGDVVEGAKIDFQYVLPSTDKPVVVTAFGQNLLQLIMINETMRDGLVAFAQELTKEPRKIYAFDENDPQQTEPKLVTIDPNKPLEVVFIRIEEGNHNWSAWEKQDTDIGVAYKLVRRKDGGLRFIDAYSQIAIFSANTTFTYQGGGIGLMLSARLSLLKTILTTEKYQRGENVMTNLPPTTEMYDPRILKTNPNAIGIAQNEAWVIVSRPGPNSGLGQ